MTKVIRCDNCGRDLTNKAVRILPNFYSGRNYYVCDRNCEDSLTESRDSAYEFYEEMWRKMCGDI